MTTENWKLQFLLLYLFTSITMSQQNTYNSVEEWNFTTEGSEQSWCWPLGLQRQGQLQTLSGHGNVRTSQKSSDGGDHQAVGFHLDKLILTKHFVFSGTCSTLTYTGLVKYMVFWSKTQLIIYIWQITDYLFPLKAEVGLDDLSRGYLCLCKNFLPSLPFLLVISLTEGTSILTEFTHSFVQVLLPGQKDSKHATAAAGTAQGAETPPAILTWILPNHARPVVIGIFPWRMAVKEINSKFYVTSGNTLSSMAISTSLGHLTAQVPAEHLWKELLEVL